VTKLRFDPINFGFNTKLNYQLSQKLNLIGKCKFNHLVISLTSPETSYTIHNKVINNCYNLNSKTSSIPVDSNRKPYVCNFAQVDRKR
jgi:hypothetical protein